MPILVIGGGSWGTALAFLLAKNNDQVLIFSKNLKIIDSINNDHSNSEYLSHTNLPENIAAINNLSPINWSEIECIFFAMPAHTFYTLIDEISSNISDIPLIICCKGLDDKNLDFIHNIAQKKFNLQSVGVLAGPNFATEITQNLPTIADLAIANYEIFQLIEKKISNENFKIIWRKCLISAQVGGIIKNIAAIACGIVMGANLGNNMRSLIIVKALQEMQILCHALGGDVKNLDGASGLADLTLTCTSLLSKNMNFGHHIGQYNKIPTWKNLPEGFYSTKSLHLFCNKYDIKLLFCDLIFRILYQNKLDNIKDEIFSIIAQ